MRRLPILLSKNSGDGGFGYDGSGDDYSVGDGDGYNGDIGSSVNYDGNGSSFFTESLAEILNA